MEADVGAKEGSDYTKLAGQAAADQISFLKREVEKKKNELMLREGLPFLFGWPWYEWAWDFFHSTNKLNFLVAANQVSKSSTQIRKCIDWATNVDKWPDLWDHAPKQFWYMYPSSKVANGEWLTKWSQFMPRGVYKNDPRYGWKAIKENGAVIGIEFNSGVFVFFKTYSQKPEDLQSASLDALFCFTAGTQVMTPHGSKTVESIQVGDLVLSKDGWAPVRRVLNREMPVITRDFTDGSSLTGTWEHPIWTKNRGWVPFGELLETDLCVNVAQWQKTCWRILSWFSSMANSTGEDQNILTDANGTTSAVRINPSMLHFGRRNMAGRCQKVLSSIIAMTTRWTTGSRISSSLQKQSTPSTINEKNGSRRASTYANVKSAEKSLRPGVRSKRFLVTALRSAGKSLIAVKARALSALGNLKPGVTHVKGFAQRPAPTAALQRVYNLDVGGSHTYFANGILTHNCDEEMPEALWDELIIRLNATSGYFNMVFTATLGQEFWRQVMEPRSDEEERFPDAFKRCVSLYDSQTYIDGTPSQWTDEKIAQTKARCKSHAEFLKRVMGRFIMVDGRKYEQFDSVRHIKPKHPVPANWHVYAGVDIGGGGLSSTPRKQRAHKSAICFVAVRPDYRMGRVFLGWRGDNVLTTSGDVFKKFLEMKKTHNIRPIRQFYDWGNKDFDTISTRAGEPFEKADKDHKTGEDIINTLFKNDMLALYEDPELAKLAGELSTLQIGTEKKKAVDDFCFASGTKISTPGPDRAIETLIVGDYVITRNGAKKVTAINVRIAEAHEYQFPSGKQVTCTPNHKFFTLNRGFQPIQSLTQSDTLCTFTQWQNQNAWCSTGSSSEDILILKKGITKSIFHRGVLTLQMAWRRFIGRFGKTNTDRFQKASLSITKMGTRWITVLKTWNVSQDLSIQEITSMSVEKKTLNFSLTTWRKRKKPQKPGTHQKPVEDGTPRTQQNPTRTEPHERLSALFARKRTNLWMLSQTQGFALINAGLQTAGRLGLMISQGIVKFAILLSPLTDTQKQRPALSHASPPFAGSLRGNLPVYNITVEDDHEYFAEGILVANCDSMRYCITRIPWDFTFLTGAKAEGDDDDPENPRNSKEQELHDRRRRFEGGEEDSEHAWNVEDELEAANDSYG